ncbi:hypothetical protein E4U21_005136 [Claviceps maximensis]|nr:hypothetical protein E4U21_005136 [Claviceps maximensis]
MKFSSILLACLPAAMAASLAYKPPRELQAMAKNNPESCVLPSTFHIKNFQAHTASNATFAANSTVLSAYKFTYVNVATNLMTTCTYHPGSVPQGLNKGESARRFACRDRNVSFIWTNELSKLIMVQKICPDTHGNYEYVAAGAVVIPVACASGQCRVRKPNVKGTFTSLKSSTHTDVVSRKHKRGIDLAFDGYN